MKKTKITLKEARTKYGILPSKLAEYNKFWLLDNGNVIDSTDSIRYIAPKQCKHENWGYRENADIFCIDCDKTIAKSPTEYDTIMDALNEIDELACKDIKYKETERINELTDTYNKVANFINKHAKR